MNYLGIVLLSILASCISRESSIPPPEDDKNILHPSATQKYTNVSKNSCFLSQLSNEFDLQVYFERHIGSKDNNDSCNVSIHIIDKQTQKIIDRLFLNSYFYFNSTFANCHNVRSYTTGFNQTMLVSDNYYGDIIVADLNFDKKDDLIVINDSGSNRGPFYSFFIQNPFQKFILDGFLTDSMVYFPDTIDSSQKTLTTYVLGSYCWIGKHIYQTNYLHQWNEISYQKINICTSKE